jgi:predicted amidohydrolase YtcJ
VIRETAVDAIYEVVPEPKRAQVDAGLKAALLELGQYGITTAIEAASDKNLLAGWKRLEKAGKLTARIAAAMPVDPEDSLKPIVRLSKHFKSEFLKVNAIKLFMDGVIESKTARMLAPYTDGSNGAWQFTDSELDRIFEEADAAGLQLHGHAIGDGAVRQFLDAVERLNQAQGVKDRRPLLAHIEAIDPSDIPRFAALGVFANMQPLWAYPDPFITEGTLPVLGEARTSRLYPFGELARAGASLVAGSDWSVTTLNPWPAIEVALTRQDPDAPGAVLGAGQELTLEQLLAAYTREGARAVFEEDRLGMLKVGYQADFVIVDRNPFELDPHQLSEVSVLETWVEGQQVFDRQKTSD